MISIQKQGVFEKRRQRVEARLASLLMESKEYSEAVSVLSSLITEVRRLVDKLLLVDIDLIKLFIFFPCQSTVRVSHRLPLVFVIVSELKQQTPRESFHCTQKVCFVCNHGFSRPK
ncbi:unnamed protein product [Prunus brigantina]